MQILVQIKAVTTFQLIDGLLMNSCAPLVCKEYGKYPTQWECVCGFATLYTHYAAKRKD